MKQITWAEEVRVALATHLPTGSQGEGDQSPDGRGSNELSSLPNDSGYSNALAGHLSHPYLHVAVIPSHSGLYLLAVWL